ncbi:hypothetical protein FAGAP_8875 [Fusarium agapanthi]|uniref:Nitroreductase domain-containing protein n=1 Tax=Fusarium agapanthi TaxID=1803897 RepID=A0A9P5E9Q9_9HYPO|nr:hypothetical protein FAGAP_8875 [Fusarium agapanthi]
MSLILKNIMPQAFGCRDNIHDDSKPAMPSQQTFRRHEIQSARNTVAETILDRHSTRAFCTGQEVPMSVIEDCFSVTQHTPSSTNIQPWRVTVASVLTLETFGVLTMIIAAESETHNSPASSPSAGDKVSFGKEISSSQVNDVLPIAEALKIADGTEILVGKGEKHTFKSIYNGAGLPRRVLVVFVRHFFCCVWSLPMD